MLTSTSFYASLGTLKVSQGPVPGLGCQFMALNGGFVFLGVYSARRAGYPRGPGRSPVSREYTVGRFFLPKTQTSQEVLP